MTIQSFDREVKHPIKLQQQPTWNSCASTCMAMMLDLPAQQVIDEFHEDYITHKTRPYDYLRSKGLDVRYGVIDQLFEWDTVYMVTVPSLNLLSVNHFVVMDFRDENWKIYDPNNGKEGKKYYTNDHNLIVHDDNAYELGGYQIDICWGDE